MDFSLFFKKKETPPEGEVNEVTPPPIMHELTLPYLTKVLEGVTYSVYHQPRSVVTDAKYMYRVRCTAQCKCCVGKNEIEVEAATLTKALYDLALRLSLIEPVLETEEL